MACRDNAVCSAYPVAFFPRLVDRLHFLALLQLKRTYHFILTSEIYLELLVISGSHS